MKSTRKNGYNNKVNNSVNGPTINGEIPKRFNFLKTRNGKCPWCYKSDHDLHTCELANKRDTSIYQCTNCNLPHHQTNNCRTKSKNKRDTPTKTNTIIMAKMGSINGLKDQWIFDSGATSNMVNSMEDFYNVNTWNETIKYGNQS